MQIYVRASKEHNDEPFIDVRITNIIDGIFCTECLTDNSRWTYISHSTVGRIMIDHIKVLSLILNMVNDAPHRKQGLWNRTAWWFKVLHFFWGGLLFTSISLIHSSRNSENLWLLTKCLSTVRKNSLGNNLTFINRRKAKSDFPPSNCYLKNLPGKKISFTWEYFSLRQDCPVVCLHHKTSVYRWEKRAEIR